jgi:hypothetical protein
MQECHHRAARARSVHLGTRLMGPLNVSGISHEAMPERVRLAPRKRAWSFPPPSPRPLPPDPESRVPPLPGDPRSILVGPRGELIIANIYSGLVTARSGD